MQKSIEISKKLSALLAERVSGNVYLTMFNHLPFHFNVTGKSIDEIEQMLTGIDADGGTSIGCGMEKYVKQNIQLDGIVIVSDGGQRHEIDFWQALREYERLLGFVPTIYLLHVPGDPNWLEQARPNHAKMETFEFHRDFDYYSLPNVVKLMRSDSFELLSEVLETPLLTFNEVFKSKGD